MDNNWKNKLKVIVHQPIGELQTLLLAFITQGEECTTNEALCQISEKWDINKDTLLECISAISFLVLDSIKKGSSSQHFENELSSIGFKERTALTPLYDQLQPKVFRSLTNLQDHVQYKGIEWRLETIISSRSLRKQLKPYALLKINLIQETNEESVIISADIPNILRLSRMLNQALLESRSSYVRKVKRNVS